MKNIKTLSNDQLFNEYQTVRTQLLNAEIGSPEEIELDILFTQLSNEIELRNIDLKSYKLQSQAQPKQNIVNQQQSKTSNKSHNSMKSIRTIVSAVILTGTMLLSNIATIPTYADTKPATTHEPNGMYNAVVTKVTDNQVYLNINDNTYSFYCDENESWQPEDKITVTLENDEVLTAQPTVDFSKVYKLSTNGTTYTNSLSTNEDLQQYANKFLQDNFNDTLTVPIKFDDITTLDSDVSVINGITEFSPKGATGIIINKDLSLEFNQVLAERVIKHELLHYELSKQGKHFADKQDDFENAIEKYGSCSNDGNTYYMHSHVLVNQELNSLSK